MIFAALVRASVMQRAANSNRSSFSSDTSPFRQLKDTLAASSAYVVPSTIGLESNPCNELFPALRIGQLDEKRPIRRSASHNLPNPFCQAAIHYVLPVGLILTPVTLVGGPTP